MAKKSMGQFISALRKANGMTQQDIADRLNVSNKAISRWERDECAPDISVIPALAELFGVTCDELLKGERILETNISERKEPKVEKQVKNLINRTLSNFKIFIWIAITLAVVGLILMFGISYGFYRPIIGFIVMLLFEVCAFVLTMLAVTLTKDIKKSNEIFEMADNTQISSFHKVLGNFSFNTFFIIFSVVIICLPFILVTSDYVEGVITPYSYFTVFFSGIIMILTLVYLKCKKPYISWIVNNILSYEEKDTISVHRNQMNLIQIGLIVLASIVFVIEPYFETGHLEVSIVCVILQLIGFISIGASIVFFIIFIVRKKERRKHYMISGIRNLFLLPISLIFSNVHSSAWVGTVGEDGPHTRCDIWLEKYFWYALAYSLFIFVVFELINALVNLKTK